MFAAPPLVLSSFFFKKVGAQDCKFAGIVWDSNVYNLKMLQVRTKITRLPLKKTHKLKQTQKNNLTNTSSYVGNVNAY